MGSNFLLSEFQWTLWWKLRITLSMLLDWNCFIFLYRVRASRKIEALRENKVGGNIKNFSPAMTWNKLATPVSTFSLLKFSLKNNWESQDIINYL